MTTIVASSETVESRIPTACVAAPIPYRCTIVPSWAGIVAT